MKPIKPKTTNFFELSKKEREKLLTQAAEDANEMQANLEKEYDKLIAKKAAA